MDALRTDPFHGLTERFAHELRAGRGEYAVPRADVEETGDAYLVEVDLPGVPADDVGVELTGGRLVVTGRPRQRARAGTVHVATRPAGRYRLELALPRPVDPDAVQASYDDGVVTVLIPKQVAARARRITVVTPAPGATTA